MKFSIVETKLGWIGLGLNGCGLRLLTLPAATAAAAEGELRSHGATEPSASAGDWPEKLRRYLNGESAALSGALDLEQGTAFQRQVWRALLAIPRGETRTYRQVAEEIERPRAARAVGQAVAANPLPIVVPCHRVVSGHGLGGYGGGLALKKKLLKLEGAVLGGREGTIRGRG